MMINFFIVIFRTPTKLRVTRRRVTRLIFFDTLSHIKTLCKNYCILVDYIKEVSHPSVQLFMFKKASEKKGRCVNRKGFWVHKTSNWCYLALS